ncbi:AAA family ATPase, partial [Clostridium botulinum]|nr:AAA family ATPase [Clostridium botulinum]
EAERLEAERLEAERKEQERLEAERLEAERKEQERLEAERLEAERKEQERLEAEQIEVSTMILKIKEEISELEEIVSKNKYKLFGKGAILKKEAKKRIQILYLKIDEISN